MDALPRWAEEAARQDSVEEEIWLLGQPALQDYLSFVETTVIDGARIARSALVEEWREANDYYHELETREAGTADRIEISDLPPSLQPLAVELAATARYRRAFDTLPTRIAMVELERLVVAQPHVNLTHAGRLRARLPARPTHEDVFRVCQMSELQPPPIRARRVGSGRYSFTSESSDLRFREAVLLRPEQIEDGERFGPAGAIVGIVVGFSSNFLTVLQSDDRLLLHNGHHRAFALLEHGVTHAPCIVQTVTRLDELNLLAGSHVRKAPAFYFRAARPPLLKDFLDPRIRKVLRVPRILQTIDVSFDVQDHEVAG